jgi:hypothetical protein
LSAGEAALMLALLGDSTQMGARAGGPEAPPFRFVADASEDCHRPLPGACELVDLLEGIARHNEVAVVPLERWLHVCGYEEEADRVAFGPKVIAA